MTDAPSPAQPARRAASPVTDHPADTEPDAPAERDAQADRRVVVIGGGFAGVKAARILRSKLPKTWDVVLFNRENHMVFSPLLAEVAGASLEPGDIAAPLRQMLPGVLCRTEEVLDLDLPASSLRFQTYEGRARPLGYAHVLIACGNSVNLSAVPGMADHAYPLKTVGDGMALRSHVIQQFEHAAVSESEAQKRQLLTFIVVGGGYSGVEIAGEINDLARESSRYYQNVTPNDVHVILIHSREQILPEITDDLRAFANRKMTERGIELVLNARVAQATADGVWLTSGLHIAGGTVVCTIGSTTARVVERLDAQKERGRLLTEPDMRLRGCPNAWAVGDCAQIINAFDGQPAPPTGQFAEREGGQVAHNILRIVRGKPTRPFHFKPLGQLCSIGGHSAVAEIKGIHLEGFLAWFLWRTVYLLKLPSWSRRFKVGVNWTFNLLFSRDLVTLRTDTTQRVDKAFFHPGDYVFHEGDPASSFYVIESGEVDILRKGTDGKEEILTVLGPGSFFGEMALINKHPRNATVRARTDLEVVIMGSRVFEQITGSLKPLQDMLARTVGRRSKDRWHRLPAARTLLEATPLDQLMEPLPDILLAPSDTFHTVIDHFETLDLDFGYVLDSDPPRLVGVVTRTDLFRALEDGATRATLLQEFMIEHPIYICASDTLLTAVSTMRECSLKWLPVVESAETLRLLGYISARQLVAYVLRGLDSADIPEQPPSPLAATTPKPPPASD